MAVRSRFGALLVATGIAWCTLAPAWAGVFSVTPVRIYMQPRDRAVAVTLVNEGNTSVVLQADVNVWRQMPDGVDVLELTEDLILSPSTTFPSSPAVDRPDSSFATCSVGKRWSRDRKSVV